MNFDWSEFAFSSKKPLRSLKATFIIAPRKISAARFKELIKIYLPKGNIVLGLANESFVLGYDGQPQFRMLEIADLQKTIDLVNNSGSPHKVYTLHYFQRELSYIIESIDFRQVVGINGSWKYAFQNNEPYHLLAKKRIPYELISPFTDEDEAKTYEKATMRQITKQNIFPKGNFNEVEMLKKADEAATFSFDYNFQTGAVLGKKTTKDLYDFIDYSYNEVVPYQTYAMLHGASRESHFSPPNDLNYYDTIHAEALLLIQAQKKKINLKGTTLFINLLLCPTCARMFCETDIEAFVYQYDHSDGYAFSLLEKAGKTVRRVVVDQP